MYNKKITFVLILTLLLVVGFLATSLTSYFVAENAMAQQLKEQTLPLTSDNIYSEIQRDLLQPLLISSLMAHDTFVTDWVADGEQNPQKIIDYLGKIEKKYHTVTAFFVSEKTHNYYHPSGIIKKVNRDDPADAWYFRARKLSKDYEINVDKDTANRSRLNIFVNYRVLDRQGKLVGVTGVGLSVKSVTTMIENYQRRYGRKIYFVNRQGDVMLHGSGFNDKVRLRNQAGLNQLFVRILTSPSASVSYATQNGNTIYLNSRLVPEFNWFLIVEQTNNPASAGIERALVVNILVSLAITALVLLIAYFPVRDYQRKLEQMATKDRLTGAASRQVFDMVFARASKMAHRKGTPIAVVSMDLDHFKTINDTYGHQCGDEAMRGFVGIVNRQVRDSDTLFRWGGEEFLLLLEDCDLAGARDIANSIGSAVKAHKFHYGRDTFGLTVSSGVTENRPGETLRELIERADRALYRAKNEGRDRVVCD